MQYYRAFYIYSVFSVRHWMISYICYDITLTPVKDKLNIRERKANRHKNRGSERNVKMIVFIIVTLYYI